MLQEEELEAEEMFDFIINGSQAEGGEEEEREHDEVVEAVVDHEDSNNYADVGDDDDDDAMTPAQSKEAAAAKTPPEAPKKQAARSKAKATELAAPQPDDEAEEVASDGEGDGQTSKGTHKDPTILLMPLFVFVLRMGWVSKLQACMCPLFQASCLRPLTLIRGIFQVAGNCVGPKFAIAQSPTFRFTLVYIFNPKHEGWIFLAHERTQVSQNVHACMHTIDGQDTKALTQLPSLPPQTSLDQAEKLCASLESDSQADLLKACLGLLVLRLFSKPVSTC